MAEPPTSATTHTTNLLATGSDAAVILARAAVQQPKIDVAAAVLADAKLQLSDADAVFAEAQSRFKAAETAYEVAKTRGKRAIFDAQRALDAAVRDMSVIRAPLHPVRRTPLEVLGLIFEFCVDLDLSQTSSAEFKRCRSQPFTLARVCSLWRRAALMQHRVWSNIDISLEGVVKTERWLQYLSNVFSRSGRSTLNLRVSRKGNTTSFIAPIIQMILPELQRCDTLVICRPNIGKDDVALPILQAEFPSLRELHLDVSWMHSSIDRIPSLLGRAPLLRNLVSGLSFAGTRPNIPNLASATLKRCSASDACLILATAKSLVELNLQLDLGADHVGRLPPIDCALGVKTLTIEYNGGKMNVMEDFASHVRFATLERLTLRGYNSGAFGRMIFFLRTAESMSSTLTRLTFDIGEDFTTAHLDDLFTGLVHCGSLSYLRLDAYFEPSALDFEPSTPDFEPSTLTHLCEGLGRPRATGLWLCPKLQVLDLLNCYIAADCDQQVIVTFVERRVAAAINADIPTALRPMALRCSWSRGETSCVAP